MLRVVLPLWENPSVTVFMLLYLMHTAFFSLNNLFCFKYRLPLSFRAWNPTYATPLLVKVRHGFPFSSSLSASRTNTHKDKEVQPPWWSSLRWYIKQLAIKHMYKSFEFDSIKDMCFLLIIYNSTETLWSQTTGTMTANRKYKQWERLQCTVAVLTEQHGAVAGQTYLLIISASERSRSWHNTC